tara:strand:+ start:156 stop:446 length:291 start_codon:yes stop_codon:yes gene_type:complete
MCTTWEGCSNPLYYVYSFIEKVSIPLPRKRFWNKREYRIEEEKRKKIITRREYILLNELEKEKCIPATLSDMEKYGNEKIQKEAMYQFAKVISGMP